MPKNTSNPDLPTIKEGWQGNPLDDKGRYQNHEYPFWPHTSDLLKWVREPKPQKEAKKQDTFRPESDSSGDFLEGTEDCIVWLGHATFYIRLSGVTFLTDPVFYSIPLVERVAPFPIDPARLTDIDYVLVSHDHRDHCQKKSLRLLAAGNPGMKVLSGLNMTMMLDMYTEGLPVQEAGWYQQYQLDHAGVEVYFLPSRHWSRRHLTDTNQRLWGAFVFKTPEKTIYFSGDTGYGSHLK
ncbi:MAG: MBL fold metallo-hydrolase, partial [Cyclobacteriaceae bacterium]